MMAGFASPSTLVWVVMDIREPGQPIPEWEDKLGSAKKSEERLFLDNSRKVISWQPNCREQTHQLLFRFLSHRI
jgi:hypothetical protein